MISTRTEQIQQEKTPRRIEPRSLSETWALDAAIQIEHFVAASDISHPPAPLVSFILTASRFRRQVFCLTAALLCERFAGQTGCEAQSYDVVPPDLLRRYVVELQHGDWRSVAAVLSDLIPELSSPPVGMVAALNKLGDDSLPRESYVALFELLAGKHGSIRQEAIRHVAKLTPKRIEAATTLHDVYVCSAVLNMLPSNLLIDGLNAAISVIKRKVPGATDASLRQSIEGLDDKADLPQWVHRWLNKAHAPAMLPGLADAGIRVIETSEHREAMSRRLRNCLKTKGVRAAVSSKVYVEVPCTVPIVVELSMLDDGQTLAFASKDIYGDRNRDLEPDVVDAVRMTLRKAGVREILGAHSDPEVRVVASMLARDTFFGFGDLD